MGGWEAAGRGAGRREEGEDRGKGGQGPDGSARAPQGYLGGRVSAGRGWGLEPPARTGEGPGRLEGNGKEREPSGVWRWKTPVSGVWEVGRGGMKGRGRRGRVRPQHLGALGRCPRF